MSVITVTTVVKVEVKRLVVSAGVMYWEDTKVDGNDDVGGHLIPCKKDDNWCPVIDLETGVVVNWIQGVVADVHYKVCDDGTYQLTNEPGKVVKGFAGYVPKILCPEAAGYGDYIIMHIDAQGKIRNWKIDLSDFEDKDED